MIAGFVAGAMVSVPQNACPANIFGLFVCPREWQILLAGFGALFAAYLTFLAARVRADYERSEIRRKERNEKRTVALAAHGQLQALAKETDRCAKAIRHWRANIVDKGSTVSKVTLRSIVPIEPMILEQLGPQIGLLPADLAADVKILATRFSQWRNWITYLLERDPREVAADWPEVEELEIRFTETSAELRQTAKGVRSYAENLKT